VSIAEASGVIEDRLEHRLNIGRRAGNHAEDLAGRGEVAIAGLQLLEQPHVLDGNDALVGERLKQRYFLVRERPYLLATEEEGPNRRSLSEERRGECRSVPELDCDLLAEREVGRCIGQVFDVNRSGVHDSPPSHPATMD
jgi:hypothetical protein